MELQPIFFYILAVLSVGGALSVLLMRSPVYCALSLVGTFGFISAIYILLNNEFVAAIQLLIYAGAIMVLFLFVIMLLNLRVDVSHRIKWSLPKLLGLAVSLGILGQLIGAFTSSAAKLGPSGTHTPEYVAENGAIEIIGETLFTEYVLPFEIISILLMVAVIGAVILAKRRDGGEEGR